MVPLFQSILQHENGTLSLFQLRQMLNMEPFLHTCKLEHKLDFQYIHLKYIFNWSMFLQINLMSFFHL